MKQCELYAISYHVDGRILENMFTCVNGELNQDEKDRCPNTAVDYILAPSGQKVFLCADHMDTVQSDGTIREYNNDHEGGFVHVPFTQ